MGGPAIVRVPEPLRMPSEHHPSLQETIVIVGNRLLYSREYQAFYAVLILLNSFVLALLFFQTGTSPLIVVLDVLITMALAVEIAIRAITQGQGFLMHFSNIFDLVVLSVCVSTVALYVNGASTMKESIQSIAVEILVVLRYVSQLLRLAVFVRNLKQASGSSADIHIDVHDMAASPHNDFNLESSYGGPLLRLPVAVPEKQCLLSESAHFPRGSAAPGVDAVAVGSPR